MILMVFWLTDPFTHRVSALRDRLHGYGGVRLRCNSLEWNNHFASLRLALHP